MSINREQIFLAYLKYAFSKQFQTRESFGFNELPLKRPETVKRDYSLPVCPSTKSLVNRSKQLGLRLAAPDCMKKQMKGVVTP